MSEKDYQKIRDFCKEFSYSFISAMWCEKEFRTLTGKDMQELQIKLENYLDLDLVKFLKERENNDNKMV